MRTRTRLMAAVALAAACSSTPTGPESGSVSITAGPAQIRQGDVATFTATVSPVGATVSWSIEPASSGIFDSDGRFVAYSPGPAMVVAESGGERTERALTVLDRGLAPAAFTILGRGMVTERFTSDLWVRGTAAYTGTWNTRIGPGGPFQGNEVKVWDVTSAGSPMLTDVVSLDAGTVNDVKVSDDGSLAVVSHEGSADTQNGVTFLDLSDPFHPTVIGRFTDTLGPGVHNLWIEGDVLYAVVDGSIETSGLRIIDIADPASPFILSSFYGGNPESNFGQFLHDVYVRDGLVFLSHWDPGLIILDVGNGMAGGSPQNPIEVGRVATSGGDTHNAWYWPAGQVVFVGEEDFGTPGRMHVVDVSDMTSPVEVATYQVPGNTPHNFWVDEESETLFVAWYSNGLFAIDVSGELRGDLDLQGRLYASMLYDGAGSCQAPTGTCSWSPQLENGVLWVSDMNSGLWALRFDAN